MVVNKSKAAFRTIAEVAEELGWQPMFCVSGKPNFLKLSR